MRDFRDKMMKNCFLASSILVTLPMFFTTPAMTQPVPLPGSAYNVANYQA